jgi:D-beta-D-heptose 7-phosphate kinase/D-beta-D-heptose 1-phosphate adenosyltransferase
MDLSCKNVSEQIGRPRVLVVGDLILDRYITGAAERVSPEAPVVVIRAESDEVRLGGAASVAALLRGLGTDVLLASVVGDDHAAATVRRLCQDEGIDCSLLGTDGSRQTTVKERFLGSAWQRAGQQMLRVDHESREPLDDRLAAELGENIAACLQDVSAVLLWQRSLGT